MGTDPKQKPVQAAPSKPMSPQGKPTAPQATPPKAPGTPPGAPKKK